MVLPIFPGNLSTPIPNNPFYSPETSYLEGPYHPALVTPISGMEIDSEGVIIVTGGGGQVNSVTGISPITVSGTAADPVIDVLAATTTNLGVIQIATTADVAAGISTALAVTPASLSANYMPLTGGTFTGPVTFGSTALFQGPVTNQGTVTNFALVENCADVCNHGTTYNIGNIVNCGDSLFCGNILTCGTVTNCGNIVNCGVVTNCALVQNCADVCNYGTTYNIGDTVTCGNTLFCGNLDVCGTTTNHGDIYNCGTTYNVGTTVTCGTALFCGDVTTCGAVTNNGTVTNNGDMVTCGTTTNCGPTLFCNTATYNCAATFCQPVTFCSTPVLPPGTALGAAIDVTYDNTTSGLTGTNVQAAIDELALLPPIATTAILGKVCIGNNVQVDPAGEISVLDASTSQAGVVELYDGVDSTSTTQALTAAQGQVLQTQINSLTAAGGLTLAGTYDAAAGQMVTVTTAGAAAGFTVGSPYPAAAPGNADFYAIVTTAGGGANKGDWYLSDGTAWSLLGVGFTAPYASTTVAGIVEFATDAEVQAGTDNTLAVTPASIQSKMSDATNLTSSTTIASSTAVKNAYDLGAAAIPCSALTAKGELIAGTGVSTYAALPVGVTGQILSVNPATPTGLSWINACQGTLTGVTASLPISVDSTTNPAVPALSIALASTIGTGVVSIGTNIAVNPAGQISVAFASVGNAGVVELYDNTDSTSTTQALTAAQGKNLQDQINALAFSSSTILAGTYDASTNQLLTVTSAGTTAGFVVGAALPAPAPANDNHYVIVTTAGGGASKGDWYLSNGTTWQLLDVGFDAPYASTTVAGIVELAELAEVQAGTDNTLAVTPAGIQSKMSDATNLTSSTTIASSTAVQSAYNLAAAAIPASAMQAIGDLIVGTGIGTYINLGAGGDGEVLTVDSSQPGGLRWVTPAPLGVVTVSGTAPIAVDNTDAQNPVVSILNGSTTQPGAVQLFDGLNSTSNTLALTAAQGKILQDQIDSLVAAGGLTLAGTFNASTSQMVTVTSTGSGAGFTVGSDLPVAAAGNTDFFVLVTTGGSYSPPGGGGPYNASVGDWFLSNGTSWDFLNVGPQPASASTTAEGVVQLATNADVQAATSTTLAVTPSTLASNVSDGVATVSSTCIASSTAVKTAYDLAAAAIPKSTIANKGDIVTGTGAATPVALTVGSNGQVLSANSACPSGLEWINGASGSVTNIATGTGLTGGPITTSGTISLADTAVTPGSYTYSSFTVDQQGRITAASNGATPVLQSDFNAKGNLLVGTANDAYAALTVGTNGQVLVADSTCTTGVTWCTVSSPAATPVTLGTLFGCTTNSSAATTLLGACAGCSLLGDARNTAVGMLALSSSATAPDNTALGACAGAGITTGGSNTVLGSRTGGTITTGSNNVVIGANVSGSTASCSLTIGWCNTSTGMNWITGNSSGDVQFGRGIIDCTGSIGTAGQALTSTATGLQWCTLSSTVPDATPTTTGGVFGKASVVSPSASTYIGYCAGIGGRTDGGNVGVGFSSLATAANATAVFNTALGYNTLPSLVNALCNTVVGAYAGCAITSGSMNAIFGNGAGTSIATGCNNVIIGSKMNPPDGNCQLVIGTGDGVANCCWITGSSSFEVTLPKPATFTSGVRDCTGALGTFGQVLSSTGSALLWCTPSAPAPSAATPINIGSVFACTTSGNSANTFLGWYTGCQATANLYNTAVGSNSFRQATSANFNTSLGSGASFSLATGGFNVTLGAYAGCSITSGCQNTVIGGDSGRSIALGSYNVVLGYDITPTSDGDSQLVIGNSIAGVPCQWITGNSSYEVTLPNPATFTSGIRDCTGALGSAGQVLSSTGTALEWIAGGGGAIALPTARGTVYACTTGATVVGDRDAVAALGFGALGNKSPLTNSWQVAIGTCSQNTGDGGQFTTAVGALSGFRVAGNDNTFLGYRSGFAVTTGSYNTIVGSQLNGLATGCCLTFIGSCERYACFSGTGTAWTFASDARLKTDVTALPVSGQDFINSLRPVEFTWLDKNTGEPAENGDHCVVGFIAQDVRQALVDANLGHITNVVSDMPDDYLGLDQSAIIPFLVKAVQELSAEMAELKKNI